MQTASPQNSKKVLLLNILDILRRYTDEDHRLSQADKLAAGLEQTLAIYRGRNRSQQK